MGVLAPGILIAAPPLADPHFDRSVVLLASHDEEGSFGWIINGAELLSLGALMGQLGLPVPSGESHSWTESSLRNGGPVATDQVWLIYPTRYRPSDLKGQLQIAPGICATASRAFLELLSEGMPMPQVRAVAGYAGWAAGQLEDELKAGAWLPGAPNAELLFQTEPSDVWRAAYALQGTSPIAFTSHIVGSA